MFPPCSAPPGRTSGRNTLANESWAYFCLENVAYHGHDVTILWDSTGQHYGQGQGLRVYVDGALAGSSSSLNTSLTVQVGSSLSQAIGSQVNIAANSQRYSQMTTAFASYTSPYDNVWNPIDGIIWRTGIPENTRWTSYGSPNESDNFGVDLRRAQAVSEVRLFFYDDGGGVRLPASYDLQYLSGGSWITVPGQQRSSSLLSTGAVSNDQTMITFPQIVTSQLRVVAIPSNPSSGNGWGLSEFEVWTAAVFQLQNANSGKLMGVQDMSIANSANIQQYEDNGTRDHLWLFLKAPGGWFKIQNINSGLLLGVQDMSTADSAQLQQYEDSGTTDNLWRVESHGGGQFLIRNQNSGLVIGVAGMSMANSAIIVQFEDNGTEDHFWIILPAVPAN